MKKSGVMVLIMMFCMALAGLSGCGNSKESGKLSSVVTEKLDGMEKESDAKTAVQTAVPDDIAAENKIYNSDMGYRITYDSRLFEIVRDEGAECFELKDQNLEKEIPVYVAMSKVEDTAKNIVKGLIRQSDKEGLKADSSNIGTGHYGMQSVFYESKEERGKVYHTFHVLEEDNDDAVLMIEIVNGDNIDHMVQNAIEEMLASFTIKSTDKEKKKAKKQPDYTVFTNISSKKVVEFANSIKEDFAEKRWSLLAQRICYPITIGKNTFKSSSEFEDFNFSGYFSKKFLKAVADTDTENLFVNADGAMFGDGEIWFAESETEKGKSEGLKITAINK